MKKRFFFFAAAAAISAAATAQSGDHAEAVKSLVDSQNYIFQAQTAMPLRGGARQLTTEYDLKVSRTAIVSDLPYFGRAYAAPMNTTQGPLQFTSKDFSYMTTPRKKGGWTVTIKPADHREIQQMTMTISGEGYTTLQVINLNRDAISFNGVIMAPPKK